MKKTITLFFFLSLFFLSGCGSTYSHPEIKSGVVVNKGYVYNKSREEKTCYQYGTGNFCETILVKSEFLYRINICTIDGNRLCTWIAVDYEKWNSVEIGDYYDN